MNTKLGFLYITLSLLGGISHAEESTSLLTPVEPKSVKKSVNPVYIGGGFVIGRYFSSTYEDVTYGEMLRVGMDYNQYLGLEARYIRTLWHEGRLYGQKLEHLGVFVKPMYPLYETINIYGLLGYGWTRTHATNGLTQAIDEHGFASGFGFEYDLSTMKEDYDKDTNYPEGFDGQADQEKGWGLFVDYQRLLVKSESSENPDLDVLSVGITYDF